MTKMEKAYILIICESGEEQSLYSKLKGISEIEDCLITYGSFDLAEFVTNSSEKTNDLIASKIKIEKS